MENQINNSQQQGSYNSKTVAGIIILGLGVLFLLKGINFILFQHWLLSWPMFLIAFAIFTGSKHNFRKNNWLVLLAVGFAFLLPNIIPSLSYAMLWPLPMIAIGLFMVFRRNQYWDGSNWKKVN
jgi:hypothetical protein